MSTWIPSLTVAQVACLALAVVGASWFLVLHRQPYENPAAATAIGVTAFSDGRELIRADLDNGQV